MRVFKLSDTRLPAGTIPHPNHQLCCVETDSYLNSYGGGYHSIQIDFNNDVIAATRTCEDTVVMEITYQDPCNSCGKTCEFKVSLGCQTDPCATVPCQAAITCFCGALKCSGCGGGVTCCPIESGSQTVTSYILTSLNPGVIFTLNPNLFDTEYVITVLQEATPFYLNTDIPVGRAVVQNTTLEYYHQETAHVPTGDLVNDRFVGIALAGEMGLLSDDFRTCCECPTYKPCESVCVISKGQVTVDLNTPIPDVDISQLIVGYINDPASVDNGKITVYASGNQPTNVLPIPNASIVTFETNSNRVTIELN